MAQGSDKLSTGLSPRISLEGFDKLTEEERASLDEGVRNLLSLMVRMVKPGISEKIRDGLDSQEEGLEKEFMRLALGEGNVRDFLVRSEGGKKVEEGISSPPLPSQK
jgi:hypothetical protein